MKSYQVRFCHDSNGHESEFLVPAENYVGSFAAGRAARDAMEGTDGYEDFDPSEYTAIKQGYPVEYIEE